MRRDERRGAGLRRGLLEVLAVAIVGLLGFGLLEAWRATGKQAAPTADGARAGREASGAAAEPVRPTRAPARRVDRPTRPGREGRQPREVTYRGWVVGQERERLLDARVAWVSRRGGEWLDAEERAADEVLRPRVAGRSWSGLKGTKVDEVPETAVDEHAHFALHVRTGTPTSEPWWSSPPEDSDMLVIWAPGHAPRFERLFIHDPDPVVHMGELVLPRAAGLVAQLVDELDGPLAGHTLSWTRTASDPAPVRQPHHRTDPPDGGSLRTDDQGGFALEHLWPGEITLRIERPERVPLDVPVTLRAGEAVDLGELRMRLGGTIRGRVLHADGYPLRGAQVFALTERPDFVEGFSAGDVYMGGARIPPEGDTVHAELIAARRAPNRDATFGDGRFEIRGLPEQRHMVYVRFPPGVPVRIDDVPPDGEPLDIVIPRRSRLRVRVVDGATGELLGDHPRGLQAWRRASPTERTKVDVPLDLSRDRHGDASLVAHGVGPTTELWIPDPGARRTVHGIGPLPWLADRVHDRADGRTLLLVKGMQPGEDRTVEIVVHGDPVLHGRVVDPDGAPLADALVEVGRAGSERERDWSDWAAVRHQQANRRDVRPSWVTLTDAQGAYELTLDGAGGGAFELLVVLGRTPAGPPVLIDVAEDERVRVDVVGRRAASITAWCLDARGRPLLDERITFVREPRPGTDERRRSYVRKTDVEGKVVFAPLTPGNVQVVSRLGAHALTLGSGAEVEFTLQEGTPPGVDVQVTCGGEPVAGLEVAAWFAALPDGTTWGRSAGDTDTDARGLASLPLPAAGRYAVSVETGGESSPVAAWVDVAWGERAHVDLVLPSGGITLQLVDALGGELDHAALQLVLLEGDSRVVACWERVDEGGLVRAPYLAPGPYRPYIGGFPTATHVRQWLPPIEVGDTWPADPVVLPVLPGARIDLQVRHASGLTARDGVPVRLLRIEDGEPVRPERPGSATRSRRGDDGRRLSEYSPPLDTAWWAEAETDAGHASFAGLPPGTYHVYFGDEPDTGSLKALATIDVETGARVEQVVRLPDAR